MDKKINLHNAPYYVRENFRDYSSLLFEPGMHLQNAELNELQLTQQDSLKEVADVFLTDGDRVTGMEVLVDGDRVIVTAGKVYFQGKVRDFEEQSVRITKTGREEIGVKLSQEIVDHTQDPNLLSQAASFENYALPGAKRLKETILLTLDDPEATTINTFRDGILLVKPKEDQESFIYKLREELARRTYDQSGNYKVYGLELSQKTQYDSDFLYLTLSEGKAYIEGWEVEKPTAITIPIPRSTAVRQVPAEPKLKEADKNKYQLNNHPANKIHRVTGEVRVTTELTRQGSVDGSDPIPSKYTPVVTIEKIIQNTDNTTYTKNTDFVLEGNSIRWLAGGRQPDLGQSYEVTFVYNKVLVQEEDYKLQVEDTKYYLELLADGDTPIDNRQIQVDYDFFLYYQAIVTMDREGNIRVVPGQPNTERDITSPDITNQRVLTLGAVTVAPKNDTLTIVNSRTERSSMDRIQRMFNRLEEMELNQAITDLDEEAMGGEDPTQLKGIFTDGFLGFTKADINHKEFTAAIDVVDRALTSGFTEEVKGLTINPNKEQNYTLSNRTITAKSTAQKTVSQPFATEEHVINPYTYAETQIYKIAILPNKEATISTDPDKQATAGSIVQVNVDINEENREFNYIMVNNKKITGDSFTMPNEDVIVAVFLKDTTPIEPEKYNITIIPEEGVDVTTTPSHEAEVGEIVQVETNVVAEQKEVKVILVDGQPISGRSFVMPNHHVTVKALLQVAPPKENPYITITPQTDNWIDADRITVREDGGLRTRTVTTTTSSWGGGERQDISTKSSVISRSTQVIDTAIEHMRVQTITLQASKFNKNQDNIFIEFNNQKVEVTPTGDTRQGTLKGSLKANNRGVVTGTFKVPEGTKAGSVLVKAYTTDFPSFIGETSYTSRGIKRLYKTTEVVQTIRTYRIIIVTGADPIAQTFEFSEDTMLDSLGLYFGKIDKDHPVTLQIREVENGYPSSVVLQEQVLDLEKLKTSKDSSVETVIKLEDPIFCEKDTQYSFTILTHSPKSSLYIQKLGKRDLLTKESVITNPYIDGLMFGSSNALAWTAYQTKNIKFNLYSRRFQQKSVVYFNTISGIDADSIALLVDTSVPTDCDLQWEYSADGEKTWTPFSSWNQTGLRESINEFTLRCTILSKENVSPIINLESILLRAIKNKETSSYVSRNVQTDMSFNNIKIVADVYTPTGTGVVFYYATDINGVEWKTLKQEGTPRVKQVGGYSEITYQATEETNYKNFRVKAVLTTNDTTITPRVKGLKCILK